MVTKWLRNRHIMRWPLLGLAVAGAAAAVITVSVDPGQAASGPSDSVALSAAESAAPVASGSDIATHYVLQSGGGNCSYPGPPANQLFVALPAPEYHGAAPCGSYLLVKGRNGNTVRVEVIDQCPECKAGHIDLSETAFAKLAPLVKGIIPVSYHTTGNPPLPAPVAFLVKNGSSRYWLALIVMNTGNAIASVQLQTAPGHWLKLTHVNWNAWIAQQGAGPGPFTVRVTDTRGHQVTIHNVALKPGAVQRTGTWMYKHNR